MLWACFGYVMRMFGECVGDVLDIFWTCYRNVWGMFWAWSGYVLGMMWACLGYVLGWFVHVGGCSVDGGAKLAALALIAPLSSPFVMSLSLSWERKGQVITSHLLCVRIETCADEVDFQVDSRLTWGRPVANVLNVLLNTWGLLEVDLRLTWGRPPGLLRLH